MGLNIILNLFTYNKIGFIVFVLCLLILIAGKTICKAKNKKMLLVMTIVTLIFEYKHKANEKDIEIIPNVLENCILTLLLKDKHFDIIFVLGAVGYVITNKTIMYIVFGAIVVILYNTIVENGYKSFISNKIEDIAIKILNTPTNNQEELVGELMKTFTMNFQTK